MGLARCTFYDPAPATLDAGEVVTRIGAICDEFECYSYRRVGAALRHQGIVVNSKKLGVVQIRVTRETWSPLVGVALAIFGVIHEPPVLNHAVHG